MEHAHACAHRRPRRAPEVVYLRPVATDTLDRLRALALDGLTPTVVAPFVRARKRVRDDGLAPVDPHDAPVLTREPITASLREGAELEWRRASRPWTPSLERLAAQGVVTVTVRSGGDVDVVMRNGTQRVRALSRPWVAVAVAMLTDRELPAVRASMRRGVNLFVPDRTHRA